MGLDIDKAGRHGEAFGIDDLFRVTSKGRAERSDAAGSESDITGGAWVPGTVNNDTTTN